LNSWVGRRLALVDAGEIFGAGRDVHALAIKRGRDSLVGEWRGVGLGVGSKRLPAPNDGERGLVDGRGARDSAHGREAAACRAPDRHNAVGLGVARIKGNCHGRADVDGVTPLVREKLTLAQLGVDISAHVYVSTLVRDDAGILASIRDGMRVSVADKRVYERPTFGRALG
jgi:hypothetical protein